MAQSSTQMKNNKLVSLSSKILLGDSEKHVKHAVLCVCALTPGGKCAVNRTSNCLQEKRQNKLLSAQEWKQDSLVYSSLE